MPKTEKVETKEQSIIIENDDREFIPERDIPRFNKMPMEQRKILLRDMGFDANGNPLDDSITTDSLVNVGGITGSITIEKALELREALDAVLEGVTETK